MNNSFQRIGSTSNSQVGRDFETKAQQFFLQSMNINLKKNIKIPLGIADTKKLHAFDLGCLQQKIIVECKSHKWTTGNNVPSAKLAVWNEAMYYFSIAPQEYRKIMFVLRDFSEKKGQTLAQYYIDTYKHLIPIDVEFWQYDETRSIAEQLSI